MHVPGRRAAIALLALLTALIGFLPDARAQDYPSRPVRLITDSAPGSAIDVPVRLIAEGLSRIWGQQAVVVNQPGAGGAIAAHSAATAAPDGYTFGAMALSAFVALPGTADNLPVQVPHDVIPVGYLGGAPMFIGAAPWLGVKTLPDLIALAKQKPGELPYGVNGIGRLTHLTGELLQRQANIKLLMVPYTGGTPQIINDIPASRSIRETGQCFSHRREIGCGGHPAGRGHGKRYHIAGVNRAGALVAPAGTPDALIRKVNADIIKAMRDDPDIHKRLIDLGRDDRMMSPAELLMFIGSEQTKWAPIVQEIAAQTKNK
jgi:tripartite-type tricarboxylate transporter receptor subunit TctC